MILELEGSTLGTNHRGKRSLLVTTVAPRGSKGLLWELATRGHMTCPRGLNGSALGTGPYQMLECLALGTSPKVEDLAPRGSRAQLWVWFKGTSLLGLELKSKKKVKTKNVRDY